MSKRRGEGRYIRSGKSAGYVEYRYGRQNESAVYRPGKSRRAPIFDADRRKALLNKIKAVLTTWHSSRFEHEGAVHSGLRSELCLAGFAWPESDEEASRLIGVAFNELGYQRPTWAQGQRDYVDAVDSCQHCGASLDEEQMAHSDRFCSSECAKVFLGKHGDGWIRNSSLTNRAARKLMATASKALVTCDHCSKAFRPRGHTKDARYCSAKCAGLAKRTLPDKVCANTACAQCFRPSDATIQFCSSDCRHEHDRRAPATLTKECALCGRPFLAKSPLATYCGNACKCRVASFRAGREVPKRVTPAVFDFFYTMPANTSLPACFTPERFDELVVM